MRISPLLLAFSIANLFGGCAKQSINEAPKAPIVSVFQTKDSLAHSIYYLGMAEYENCLPKVILARSRYEKRLRQLFKDKKADYPAQQILLRGFKQEKKLELWAKSPGVDTFQLIKTYPVCKVSGQIGAKRQRGDNQSPEGFYWIDIFNGDSPNNYMGFRVDFPNQLDEINGNRMDMGGSIYVHGGCSSVGCLAVGDSAIQELYLACLDAILTHHRGAAVHLFPSHLTNSKLTELSKTYANRPKEVAFWRQLQKGYLYFEQKRRLPDVIIDSAKTNWSIVN